MGMGLDLINSVMQLDYERHSSYFTDLSDYIFIYHYYFYEDERMI